MLALLFIVKQRCVWCDKESMGLGEDLWGEFFFDIVIVSIFFVFGSCFSHCWGLGACWSMWCNGVGIEKPIESLEGLIILDVLIVFLACILIRLQSIVLTT